MKHRLPLMIALVAGGWTTPSTAQSTAPVEMALVALDDSTSYLVYRYEAVLPTGSFGVAALALDVASPYGESEQVLAATGPLNDFTRFGGTPVTNAVEVGPISTGTWGAVLPGDGKLIWTGVNNSWLSVDSIAPGDALSGIGLRSSFLPGVREVATWPTRQACCNEPWGTAAQNPDRAHRNPDYFAVSSYTVGEVPARFTHPGRIHR